MPEYQRLIQFEVGSIQRYIFESDRLRDIRGASALLDEVNRIKVLDIVGSCDGATAIRASGGVSVVGFTEEGEKRREDLENEIRRLYASEIPGAAIYRGEVRRGALSDPEMLRMLSYATSLNQWHRPVVGAHPFLSGPMIKFCPTCGVRATVQEKKLVDEYKPICEVCLARRNAGEGIRRGAVRRFFNQVEGNQAWREYSPDAVLPEDLNNIGEHANGEIGLILADGNRLGQTLRKLETIDDYARFSRQIADTIEEAVFETLSYCTPRETSKGKKLPWEIVFMGGDDIMLVTSADIVLDVAMGIMECVEKKTEQVIDAFERKEKLQRSYLSMAAGVAISPPHFPINSLYYLANDLEKEAKKKAYSIYEKGSDSDETSTIDFHRITATGNTALEQVRDYELKPRRSASGTLTILTRRPFTIAECRNVLQKASAWRSAKLPKSKIHSLYDALFESPTSAIYTWAKVVGRAKGNDLESWQELETLTRQVARDEDIVLPWYRLRTGENGMTGRATYLLDIIDIWSLLSDPQSNDEQSN